MDLTSIIGIKKVLRAFNVKVTKEIGQHFLIDERVLEKIIETADIGKKDLILEIGPGLGILTKELCRQAGEVIAVELDEAMIPVVKTSCLKDNNLKIVQKNALEFETDTLGEYKVVSNLPYYITSPLIRKMLESNNQPREMVLLVQKEVAERICAKPSRMSILAISVQFYGDPSLVAVVKKEAFYPTPKIDSAILKIRVYNRPLFEVDKKIFFRLVKAGFGEKRKQLINSFSGGLSLSKEETLKIFNQAELNPEYRAESLSMTDWYKLYVSYCEFVKCGELK